MTVSELIEKLKEYPADMMVLVDGYEDGFDKIGSIGTLEVVHYPKSYEGEYSGNYYDLGEGPNFEALILSR